MASNKTRRRITLISLPIIAGLGISYLQSVLNTPRYLEFREITAYSADMSFHDFEPRGGFVVIRFCEGGEGGDGCDYNSTTLVNVPVQIYRNDNTIYTVSTDIYGAVTITDANMIGFSYPLYIEIDGNGYQCSFIPNFDDSEYEITINTSFGACPGDKIQARTNTNFN